MNKRYLVYWNANFYPCGGHGDYRGQHDTVDACVAAFNEAIAASGDHYTDWFQVLDTNSMKVVVFGNRSKIGGTASDFPDAIEYQPHPGFQSTDDSDPPVWGPPTKGKS